MRYTEVRFSNGTAEMALYYPKALQEIPLERLQKIFRLMFTGIGNETAIEKTFRCIEELQSETKAEWDKASVAYQALYVAVDWHPELDKRGKRKAKAQNNKLLEAVKSTRHKHLRANKLLALFEEGMTKYGYQDLTALPF